jgi:hypothetical protein
MVSLCRIDVVFFVVILAKELYESGVVIIWVMILGWFATPAGFFHKSTPFYEHFGI